MPYVPGESGNQNGRPLGKRDNKYRKYQIAAEQENLPDPVIFMHRKLQDESIDLALRAQMAANLSPYYYPKWGTTSPPPSPIYNEHPINLPPPTSIAIAKENISKLIAHYAAGELDQASYDRLIAGNVAMINALLGQEKLLVSQGDTGHDTTIRIEGGLPALPGTNITMPEINGNASGYAALPEPSTLNPSSIDGVHTAEPATPSESIPLPAEPQDPSL
jgi:hypothetical protein